MPIHLREENEALLKLSLVHPVNSSRLRRLMERLGSATKILAASDSELQGVGGLSQDQLHQLREDLSRVEVSRELDLMERHGVSLSVCQDSTFPPSLLSIPGPPLLLYVRGQILEEDGRAVALVGSRTCTSYGRRVTENLARGLAREGVTVVSGLAIGVDTHAHRACLEAGGRTIAVLAGGLKKIYPSQNKELAEAVCQAGAVITESSMEQPSLAQLFPVRNRIISGLSTVVVLVEAGEKSGARITATHAAEQGKTAMAVPGPIDSEASSGCHSLLRQGGILCRGVEDILEELEGVSSVIQQAKRRDSPAPVVTPPKPPPILDPVQQRIWDNLHQIRSIDELVQTCGLEVHQLNGVVMIMEMSRLIRRLPGNRYERM